MNLTYKLSLFLVEYHSMRCITDGALAVVICLLYTLLSRDLHRLLNYKTNIRQACTNKILRFELKILYLIRRCYSTIAGDETESHSTRAGDDIYSKPAYVISFLTLQQL